MTTKNNTCGNCIYWTKQVDSNNVAANQGQCRFNPPTPIAVPQPGGLSIMPMFPILPGEMVACSQFDVLAEPPKA